MISGRVSLVYSGQSAVGDIFNWFVNRIQPGGEFAGSHEALTREAEGLRPGESGLLALDWWNGNRSVLVDVDLTGMLLGMTLATKPEEIYRALIEATAYGTRLIIETFNQNNVPIRELIATGGLPDRNKLLMQIYSDVTGLSIFIPEATQIGALGSAMHGAVAAGSANGGYDTIVDASVNMARLRDESYQPIPENKKLYDILFDEYVTLHDYFGRGGNDVMKKLKDLKVRMKVA